MSEIAVSQIQVSQEVTASESDSASAKFRCSGCLREPLTAWLAHSGYPYILTGEPMLRERDEDGIGPDIMQISLRGIKLLVLVEFWVGGANEWSLLVFDLPAPSGCWVNLLLGQSSRKKHPIRICGSEAKSYRFPQRLVYSIVSL